MAFHKKPIRICGVNEPRFAGARLRLNKNGYSVINAPQNISRRPAFVLELSALTSPAALRGHFFGPRIVKYEGP